MRQKTCKGCRERFAPVRPMQSVCSPACAIVVAQRKREAMTRQAAREERAKVRAAKERIKSRAQWLKEAQAAVNAYVRERDSGQPCISCDRPDTWDGQWHASHFRSVGAASAVRFNVFNIHKACSICNHHLSGNIQEYRPRLVEKIGLERVLWLEAQNQVVRYDVGYLKRIKMIFLKKKRVLERRRLSMKESVSAK